MEVLRQYPKLVAFSISIVGLVAAYLASRVVRRLLKTVNGTSMPVAAEVSTPFASTEVQKLASNDTFVAVISFSGNSNPVVVDAVAVTSG